MAMINLYEMFLEKFFIADQVATCRACFFEGKKYQTRGQAFHAGFEEGKMWTLRKLGAETAVHAVEHEAKAV